MLLAIHGGAGDKKPSVENLRILRYALESGFEKLKKGESAIEAVVEAIAILEDSGIFNAGAGGVLQMDGVRRLDASLMEGNELQAGSVIGLEEIRNPIRAARLVMDLPHVMLTNVGAQKIAKAHGLAQLASPSSEEIAEMKKFRKAAAATSALYQRYFSTVGAVARDSEGNLAAGSSTGGVSAMLPGRVGDTPIIGAGVYADNRCGAVSCTGSGEHIIRIGLAKDLCSNSRAIPSRKDALRSLDRIEAIGGSAGIIFIAAKGSAVIMHTTKFMASGYISRRATKNSSLDLSVRIKGHNSRPAKISNTPSTESGSPEHYLRRS